MDRWFGRVVVIVLALTLLSVILSMAGCTECEEQPPLASIQEIDNFHGIEFCSGGTTLVGKLVVPEGNGPFPLLVFAHGSGESATKDTYDPIVVQLQAAGYACFIPDKRGVGDSKGQIPAVSEGNSKERIQLLADDLLAAMNFVDNLKEINTDQIGFFGGSQAGWVIALAASQTDIVDFIIIVNGSTIPLLKSVYWENITLDGGFRSEDRQGYLVPMDESERERLSELLADYDGKPGFDPREPIKMITVPGIWLWGDLDPNVPARECKAVLEEIIEKYDKPFTIYYEEDSGHTWPEKEQAILDWLAVTVR